MCVSLPSHFFYLFINALLALLGICLMAVWITVSSLLLTSFMTNPGPQQCFSEPSRTCLNLSGMQGPSDYDIPKADGYYPPLYGL